MVEGKGERGCISTPAVSRGAEHACSVWVDGRAKQRYSARARGYQLQLHGMAWQRQQVAARGSGNGEAVKAQRRRRSIPWQDAMAGDEERSTAKKDANTLDEGGTEVAGTAGKTNDSRRCGRGNQM